MTIEEFIENCKKRPIREIPMAQVKLLAKELAEGATLGIWEANIESQRFIRMELPTDNANSLYRILNKENNELIKYTKSQSDYQNHPLWKVALYLEERWENHCPHFSLLLNNSYIELPQRFLKITDKSFNLLNEVEEATVFISYKRSESSAFALLANNTLKQHGIEPFIDMQLEPGDDWHAELEEHIKNSDYFIILLGNETLNSEVTVKEIQWAIEGNVTLIPIWHNGFEFDTEKWEDLPDEVSQALSSTHTIRVLEENPLTYDTALRELLNRFGIST